MTHTGNAVQNEVLDKNLQILKEYYQEIYDNIIKRLEEQTVGNESIEAVSTKNGLVNFSVSRGDRKFFLHSNYDPYKEGYVLTEFEDDKFDTVIIYGLGLGYHVEQFIERFPERNKIIIEPDYDIFLMCMESRDITHILRAKNVYLIVKDNKDGIFSDITYFYRYSLIYSLKFIQLVSYKNINNDLWQNFQSEFIRYLNNYVINVRTMAVFNMMWLNNFFMNIQKLHQIAEFGSFKDQFESVPAVLVSAGPSLEKNMHYLKQLENKAVIVAAGSALTPLLKNGIIPHMTVGIDGSQEMSDVFNKVDREDILLAFILNLHYDCIQKYKGPLLFLKTEHEPHVKYFENEMDVSSPRLKSGGSVAHIALDTLFNLGCEPIIMIGQDLAYTNMKSHVDGRDGAETIGKAEAEKSYVKTKDMYGNDIYTIKVFLTMKDWFDSYFTDKKGQRTFINASAGGLELKNTVHMDFEEAIEKYFTKTYDIRSQLNHLHKESLGKKVFDEEKIWQFIEKLNEDAKKVKKMSDKRIKMCQRVINSLKKGISKNYSEKLKEINKITKKLEEDTFYTSFVLYRSNDIIIAHKNSAEREALQEKDMHKKLLILYEGLINQFRETAWKIEYIIETTEKFIEKQGGAKDEQ
ncbi:MAG: DUF115 domain-containing protein [Clostridia bacterium]|nr:DUF115 domain-containing protein [Clostridia bacterium]